ncbi:hypothetical protein KY290_005610 [Solanum tuberosum]|uniref:Uncharacterized protein n=1 Tax=Solanum tuberosum TaxID=4113 RepID=A0ABQ7WEN0_SOLTU|nr:hypothetical protein KY290_005610 [Solanum tuberosum]
MKTTQRILSAASSYTSPRDMHDPSQSSCNCPCLKLPVNVLHNTSSLVHQHDHDSVVIVVLPGQLVCSPAP